MRQLAFIALVATLMVATILGIFGAGLWAAVRAMT
jgi:hypothetical protein